MSTYLERHEVIASELTELDEIEKSQGDSAVRKALKRLSSGEQIDDIVAEDGPVMTAEAADDRDDGEPDA